MNFRKLLIPAVTVIAGLAHGDLTIDNFVVSTSYLYFEVTGIVDSVGLTDTDSLFIGLDNSKSYNWLLSYGTISFADNGGTYDPNHMGVMVGSSTFGEYIYTNSLTAITVGDTVDFSFSITGPDIIDPSVLAGKDFIISAGYNETTSGLPDATVSTGGGVVPEPSTYALVFSLCTLGFVAIRRKKR